MHNSVLRLITAAVVVVFSAALLLAQGKGFDTSRMDTSVDACTDFFEYANGSWLKSTQIPPTETRWGSFNILIDNNNEILKNILETAAKTKAPKGSDSQLIGDYYSSCMNEAAIDKAGISPLTPYFKQIDKIKTEADLQKEIATLHNAGLPVLFGFGGSPDLKNSNMVIVSAGQGGLSLPNSDYYTKDDAKSVEIRAKFVEYMTNMFKLLGDDQQKAAANADTVLKMQTRLAKASLTPVERRNPDNNYNKIPISEVQQLTPNFVWADYIAARDTPSVTEINIAPPKFFKEMNAMLTDVPIAQWKTYLRWMAVNSSASTLAKPFADENFNFFRKYLNGQKEKQPRWKTCVQATDRDLGEALGMEYAKVKFTPEMKSKMNVLIDNLMASLKNRINGLEWMSDATRQQAQTKLATFKRKIGYPDVLRGYNGLSIDRKSYFGNNLRSGEFQIRRNFQDIGKPRDKTRMGMTPPTVNASYNPTNNDITFPAGILQPPFYNYEADDAINYGAIGGVIGHEVTHGFDDSGSRFDSEGNLKMWWTDADRKNFDERTACVIDQFNHYEVQPGVFVDGRLTLGENMGDFAGLTVAYDAYMKSLEGKPRPADIDGFTPEQRFFLGWAQVWAAKSTPEAERSQVKGDPHSPARFRVIGPLSNMPQFAKAFGCKSGQPMVRANSCAIW